MFDLKNKKKKENIKINDKKLNDNNNDENKDFNE